MNLKLELQKLRSTSEKEIKKIKKAQLQNTGNGTHVLTTNGSGGDPTYNHQPNINLNYSFDPYL